MPRIGGVVSGMDTDTILAQLKAIAQRPIAKLQAKQAELDKKAAAWDAVDLKFAAFRGAAQAVTDQFSTRTTLVTSSNPTLLSANVTGRAEPGVRVVRVTQTARGQESMSTKFATVDETVMAPGTLTLRAGNGTTDHDVTGSTLLSTLNGGAGVTLGSIRVTDRSGASVVVDLTGSVTVQDVLDQISSAAGVKVTAKVNDNGTGFMLEDNTGLTTGGLAVAEEGGTTAASLHLMGVSSTGKLVGTDTDPLYTVTVDTSNNTLEGLRDALNNLGGPFSAAILNDGSGTTPFRLSVVSQYTGAAGAMALTSSDAGFSFTTTQTAQNAKIEIGTTAPQEFQSSTNTFDNAIQGLSLTVLDADAEKTIHLTVQSNVGDAVAVLQRYIDAYNGIVTEVSKQNSYDAETKTRGGPLFNDTLLASSLQDLTQAVTENVSGLSTEATSIFQVGVKAGKGGLLEVDQATLTDWVRNRFSDVQNLFTSSLNGALTATRMASSTATGFNVDRVADGRTDGANFGVDNDGWMDDTPSTGPDYLTLQLASPRTITRAVVHTLNTDAQPVASWGLKDYDIEALSLGGDPLKDSDWTALASVRGNARGVNSHVINSFTQQLRLKMLDTNAADGRARLVEFEAMEATGVSRRTTAVVNRLSDSVGGLFSTARQQIKDERTRLNGQIESANDRVDREIAKLEKQFNQMEQAMSKNQTMSNALTNALNGSAAAKK